MDSSLRGYPDFLITVVDGQSFSLKILEVMQYRDSLTSQTLKFVERNTEFLANLSKVSATFFDFRHTGRLDLLLTAKHKNGEPILAGIINNDDIKDN
jgi:hypothetical protein